MASIEITIDGKKIILSDLMVNNIVLEWYTNGMFPAILQDEDGRDLEELQESYLYTDENIGKHQLLNIKTKKNEN